MEMPFCCPSEAFFNQKGKSGFPKGNLMADQREKKGGKRQVKGRERRRGHPLSGSPFILFITLPIIGSGNLFYFFFLFQEFKVR